MSAAQADWETVARELAADLEEANVYIAEETDFSYWRGYEEGRAWAKFWCVACIGFAIADVALLVFG